MVARYAASRPSLRRLGRLRDHEHQGPFEGRLATQVAMLLVPGAIRQILGRVGFEAGDRRGRDSR
jgi:hypothetical protein